MAFKGSVFFGFKAWEDKGVEGGGGDGVFSDERGARDFNFTNDDDDDEEGRDFEIKDVASRIDEELGRDLCCWKLDFVKLDFVKLDFVKYELLRPDVSAVLIVRFAAALSLLNANLRSGEV